ncbi:hypothetical protein [Actinokineospora sp. NPDC004072]
MSVFARVVLAAAACAVAAWAFRGAFDDTATAALLHAVLWPVAAAAVWGCAIARIGAQAAGALG